MAGSRRRKWFGEVLDRCGRVRGRVFCGCTERAEFRLGLGLQADVYEAADGETLTIRWKGPPCTEKDTTPIKRQGRVIGKEYQSGIAVKTRDLWDWLRRMLHWK
jgi:hypothetical protein